MGVDAQAIAAALPSRWMHGDPGAGTLQQIGQALATPPRDWQCRQPGQPTTMVVSSSQTRAVARGRPDLLMETHSMNNC